LDIVQLRTGPLSSRPRPIRPNLSGHTWSRPIKDTFSLVRHLFKIPFSLKSIIQNLKSIICKFQGKEGETRPPPSIKDTSLFVSPAANQSNFSGHSFFRPIKDKVVFVRYFFKFPSSLNSDPLLITHYSKPREKRARQGRSRPIKDRIPFVR